MHSNRNWMRIGVATALALAMQVGAAQARDKIESNLTSPSGERAAGRARVLVAQPSNGRLDLRVRGLAPNQRFDVLVGAVKVGTLQTTGGGQGGLRFRSRPRGRDLLLGFDPRGALLTVRDASGVDVLVGTIASGGSGNSGHGGGGGGGDDGDKLACCIPDDRGTECEDRTAEACLAQGGTPAATTSCLPNPCEGAPPVETDVVCCLPDDSGPECEDRTVAECMAQGGTVVAATSCADNPCSATPPADPDIQCCLPDDSGSECEDRTPAQCAAQGGVDMGPGSCSPNPCADLAAPGDDSGGDHGGGSGGGGRHGGQNESGDDRGRDTRPGYY
ncbi:MAG: hypothetical protein SF182_30010 [Deltaproteobacteria bacterium]|nr:hypothetical protein [Deltaproteobacteria bacterium]